MQLCRNYLDLREINYVDIKNRVANTAKIANDRRRVFRFLSNQ